MSIVRESSRIGKEAEKSFFVVVEEKMMSGSGGVHETMVKSESVDPGWSSPSLIVSDLGVGGGFSDSCIVASQGVGSIVHGWSWSQPLNKSLA